METAHRLPCGILRLLPLSREDGRAWIERLKPACLPCVGRDSVNHDRQRDGSLKSQTYMARQGIYLQHLQNRSSRNMRINGALNYVVWTWLLRQAHKGGHL